VRDRLKGKGLDIRELDRELVISVPGQPEKGRIYINLTTGEVSHRRVLWDYLGLLEGHGNDRDPDEPGIDADTIIHTLTRASGPVLLPASDTT
jgi:hypothetical protein